MKKFTLVCMLGAVSLTGCVANPNGTVNQGGINPNTAINTGIVFGKAVLQNKVRTECQSALNSNSLWRSTRVFLSSTKKKDIPTKVCGCVALESTQNVTIEQLTLAAVDKRARYAMVSNAVATSLDTCLKRFIYK